MRGYELMYILEPTLDEEATKATIGQIEEFIKNEGVTVEGTDAWGKRRMAYRIGRHQDGYYVLSRLRAEAKSVSELERRLRVTAGVLRFLTVRVDKEQEKIERRRARKAARESARRERRQKAAAAGSKRGDSDATRAPHIADKASPDATLPGIGLEGEEE
jgi:small subunit ribosomal protein S6